MELTMLPPWEPPTSGWPILLLTLLAYLSLKQMTKVWLLGKSGSRVVFSE
jgi:hypothetical protein